jgi:hypothetical protein
MQLCIMKNIRIISFLTVALLWVTLTQGQARDGSLKVGNENMQAVTININQPHDITSDALNHRLLGSGLKAKTRNGLTKYNRVTLTDISPDQLDIYTKVEKGPGNSSIVTMAVSRGYASFTNNPADSTVTVKMKEYLESFVQTANYHSADVDINNHILDVNKEEKLYQQLLTEQGNLYKKKSDIDNRLSEIQRELRLKEELITKKKSDLEVARTKRTN